MPTADFHPESAIGGPEDPVMNKNINGIRVVSHGRVSTCISPHYLANFKSPSSYHAYGLVPISLVVKYPFFYKLEVEIVYIFEYLGKSEICFLSYFIFRLVLYSALVLASVHHSEQFIVNKES